MLHEDVEFNIMLMLNKVFRLTLIFLLNIVTIQTFAQGFISGLITDDESGAPVQAVTVYINGTTRGTITDHSGEFNMHGVELPSELILSHVSYELRRIPLQDTSQLVDMSFSLHKRIINLEEATIFHEQPLRVAYMERFKAWFLGVNHRDQEAEIINDSILIFNIYENEQFSVNAHGPILVYLPLSGYTLKVDLVHFHLRYEEELEGYHCSILGYYFFDPVDPGTRRQRRSFARNRVENYYNSSMHFCRSLYQNQLAENGYVFENTCVPKEDVAYSNDYRYDLKAEHATDDFGNKQLLLTHSSCNSFRISYFGNARNRPVDLTFLETNSSKIQGSGFRFLSDTVRIYPSGRIPENSILFSNSIGEKGIAYMLPEDYIPSMQ